MSSANQNPFDRASKAIVRRAGTGLLAWLLGVSVDELRFDRWLDTHLSVPGQSERIGDLVAHVPRIDQELHLLAQTAPAGDVLSLTEGHALDQGRQLRAPLVAAV